VADGATETSFARTWARLLVRAYCRGNISPQGLAHHLPGLQALWRMEALCRPLPWYAEEKVRKGAFSSIAGVTVQQDGAAIRWSAAAIGDSCIFQVRGDELLESFPLSASEAFNNRPQLLSSNAVGAEETTALLRTTTGRARQGDLFLLMSDALAAWFLAASERGETPWQRLFCSEAFGGGSFEDWIGGRRAEREIRNDDVTLLTVHLT
jgi:hypothetical protein